MPPPPEHHNGVIRHYNVSCTELKSGIVLQRLTINSTTESLVDSLHPFYDYSCAVAAITIQDGPFSSNVTITTAQDGRLLSCSFVLFTISLISSQTAPSAAPVGLTVISQFSTSITLSWSLPPEENQNGIITGYSVHVTNTTTGQVLLLSTTMGSISVTSLSPYTAYHCSVAAQTTVGLGPYTLPVAVLTNEDRKP